MSPICVRLEPKTAKGGISTAAPPRLASGLHSLPPILHMTAPSPMPGYSKAPQGLFVLPQVARVFTGTVISPSPPSRQWPSRSTIHAGRNLPDKGLRYLRHFVTPPGPGCPVSRVGRSFLPPSACRHTDRTISSRTFRQRVRRMVSEDSAELVAATWTLRSQVSVVFPADCPHRSHCYLPPYDVRDQ